MHFVRNHWLWACSLLFLMPFQIGCSSDEAVDDTPASPAGDDDTTAGDDDTGAGDDDAQGDDDTAAGDEDAQGDDDTQTGDDDTFAGDDDTTEGDTTPMSPTNELLVSNADGARGTLSTLTTAGLVSAPDVLEIGPDTRIVTQNSRVFLLVTSPSDDDYISEVDPWDHFSELRRIPLATGAKPRDLVLYQDKGYCSLWGTGGVLVFDGFSGASLFTIDLSAYGDGAVAPNPSDLMIDGTTLYVGLQRLDKENGVTPASPGMVIPISLNTELAGQPITLIGTRVTTLHALPDGDLLVASSGDADAFDGGIERINGITQTSNGFILMEESLGITAFEEGFVALEDTGYLNGNGILKAFTLASGEVLEDPSWATGIPITHLAADGGLGLLALSDTDGDLWLYDHGTGVLLTQMGQDVGALPPFQMAFHAP